MLSSSLSPLQVAISLGDPAGIGPEVALKALAIAQSQGLLQHTEITLIGSPLCWQTCYESLRSRADVANPADFSQRATADPQAEIQTGEITAESGEVSFRALEAAIAGTLAGEFEAIVTAPIAKAAWQLAGHGYPGQTEVLAEAAQVSRSGMLFVARSPQTGWQLRTLLATTHIPLRDVPHILSPELLTQKLSLLIDCLRQDFGIDRPTIAIAGLNPHSGEQGRLGREEQDWLIPWLEAMRDRFPQAQLQGPQPPDTLWLSAGQAWQQSGVVAPDAYLALYHDQGLIPVKLLAFDRAVNTTIGLPFVRTSPDHGTAFDIAGQGIARPESFLAALQLAIALAHNRRQRSLQLETV
ncbi:4-hydroxythreonine-4-phosphate dehydrogenase PdxA [Synechococcus elongatus]|uniref:4-hydroxythreonine-4-phosphate dehydrogenase PdxA n=1 Tax=Synechococcus elongatus TaxID=32046 RepID=UPI0030CBE6C6